MRFFIHRNIRAIGWSMHCESKRFRQDGGRRSRLCCEAPQMETQDSSRKQPHPTAPGFRRLAVTSIDQESEDVISITMQCADGEQLEAALPGQYVVLRLQPTAAGTPLFRSYSLSGPVSTERYRISVKIEPNGAAGGYLRDRVGVGDALDVSSPRGSFILENGERPVVLLSAGIGATPVLAMLYLLAAARSTRQVFWLHAARDRAHHPFAAEVRRLTQELPHGRTYVCYSRPGASDQVSEDFDAKGHL